MRSLLLALVAVVTLPACLARRAPAGEFNEVLSVGNAAPVWSNLPGVDRKKHSLSDFKDKKVVVVVFTCNSCPVARDYEDRIVRFAKEHASDVAVVAINVNRIPEDRMPKMQEKAKEKEFPFPYLFDETQKIAKDYGATITPEFFVLSTERKIVYMGGMDDNSDGEKVTTNYLEPAVRAALAGTKPETIETYARGCQIRYEREKR